MKNKQIITSWNKIESNSTTDTNMLHAILTHKRIHDKRQEQRDIAFVCLVQIMLFLMALSIIAIVLMISPGVVGVLLASYVAFGVLIGAIIILLHSKNSKKGANSHD